MAATSLCISAHLIAMVVHVDENCLCISAHLTSTVVNVDEDCLRISAHLISMVVHVDEDCLAVEVVEGQAPRLKKVLDKYIKQRGKKSPSQISKDYRW